MGTNLSVRNADNGINIDVLSDQNGVIFYTGNMLNLTRPSDGISYSAHDGFTLETNNYPDAVNKVNRFHNYSIYLFI